VEPNQPRELLDSSAILDRVGGDVDFLEEIAALFAEDSPKLLGDIRRAIEAGNAGALERAAHTLKGSVANFGAEPAREAALQLEMMGRSGNLAPAVEVCNVLEREITRFTAALLALARQLKPV
jgi:HPt (histidine-containing phosphotransfer) domain-containing protein